MIFPKEVIIKSIDKFAGFLISEVKKNNPDAKKTLQAIVQENSEHLEKWESSQADIH